MLRSSPSIVRGLRLAHCQSTFSSYSAFFRFLSFRPHLCSRSYATTPSTPEGEGRETGTAGEGLGSTSPSSTPLITEVKRLAFASKRQAGEYIGTTAGGGVLFLRDDIDALATPGATVEYEVVGNKRKLSQGRVTRVIEQSPHYVAPLCPHFGECGGCKFQHIAYEKQLEEKLRYMKHTLRRFIGEDGEKMEQIVGCKQGMQDGTFGYRNKMDFTFGEKEGDVVLGMHKKGSWSEVVNLSKCLLQQREGQEAFEVVGEVMKKAGLPAYRKTDHTGFLRHCIIRQARGMQGEVGDGSREVMVEIVTSEPADEQQQSKLDTALSELRAKLEEKVQLKALYWSINTSKSDTSVTTTKHQLTDSGVIHEMSRRKGFRISPLSFFQTNTAQAEVLFSTVEAYLDKCGVQKGDLLIDLFCGAGAIGLAVADRFESVIGIEVVEQAVKDARVNAQINNIHHASFHCGDAGKILLELEEDTSVFENKASIMAIVDPPRAGMDKKAIKAISKLPSHCDTLIYVSCSPATLARDLASLSDKTQFRLDSITPVDMFPHTPHIEAVALLKKVEHTQVDEKKGE